MEKERLDKVQSRDMSNKEKTVKRWLPVVRLPHPGNAPIGAKALNAGCQQYGRPRLLPHVSSTFPLRCSTA